MVDPSDGDANRLDAQLDGARRNDDALAAFAERIVREASLPHQTDAISDEQRERIRARVFGGATDIEKARPTVNANAFAPNGATPTPIAIREPERPAPSKLSVLMTAALVAIIVVAGFGLLRGGINLPGGGGDPAPTGMPALAWSPIASPAAATDCSRDQWVTVFDNGVPDILKDTAHATLDDGTLTWRCGGESEELATNVRSASGVFWPGVISIVTEDDDAWLLNIASDTSLDLDGDLLLNDDGNLDLGNAVAWSGGPEPWVAVRVNADRTDWRIIDVRSMASLLLSDELGGLLPEPADPEFGQITGTDVAVVTWRPASGRIDGTPFPGGVQGLAQERALVLPGSIDKRRWIEVTEFRDRTIMRGSGFSQLSAVRFDGRWVAYPTLTDTSEPIIRVEDAVTGVVLADVAVDNIDRHTRFALAGDKQTYLAYTDVENLHIATLDAGSVHEITTVPVPGSDVLGFLPTTDPNTILIANSGTSVTPVDVRSGERSETWKYVPPPWGQLFGTYELPRNLVRVVSNVLGGTPATIQLVDPATGEIVLESDPVDAHPIQIVSFNTSLRNGGDLAVVPIGYNRAVVLDAATRETWQIAAPVDDDRLWRFFPSYDGRFVTAYPEPSVGTTYADRGEAWVAPLETDAEWVPLDGAETDMLMLVPGTPTG